MGTPISLGVYSSGHVQVYADMNTGTTPYSTAAALRTEKPMSAQPLAGVRGASVMVVGTGNDNSVIDFALTALVEVRRARDVIPAGLPDGSMLLEILLGTGQATLGTLVGAANKFLDTGVRFADTLTFTPSADLLTYMKARYGTSIDVYSPGSNQVAVLGVKDLGEASYVHFRPWLTGGSAATGANALIAVGT